MRIFTSQFQIRQSGWGDNFTPNEAEIKAYFNGWIMFKSGTSELYDGVGDKAWIKKYQGSGTVERMSFDALAERGTAEYSCPTTKSNGSSTKHYELRYKLGVPDEYSVIQTGTTPYFETGINTISIFTGIVREKAPIAVENTDQKVMLNAVDSNKTTGASESKFNKQVKRILKIERLENGKLEDVTSEWTFIHDPTLYYGEVGAVQNKLDYDTHPNAEYYVTYETLNTEGNSGLFTATVNYDDSASAVLATLVKQSVMQNAKIASLEKTILEMTGGSGSIHFEYDENGNLKNVTTE